MGKGHYQGGSTLVGFGSTSGGKTGKGGRGGGGHPSGAAMREQRRVAEKERKKKVDAKVRANEKLLRVIGKGLVAEEGRAHYDKLVKAQREKSSPLAAALQAAMAEADKLGE